MDIGEAYTMVFKDLIKKENACIKNGEDAKDKQVAVLWRKETMKVLKCKILLKSIHTFL